MGNEQADSHVVQAHWNDVIGGSVRATGEGLVSTAPDGSQVYIQNGIIGTRNPNGATKWTLEEELGTLKSEIAALQVTVAALEAQLSEKENE